VDRRAAESAVELMRPISNGSRVSSALVMRLRFSVDTK
jgi:hypothetical protein